MKLVAMETIGQRLKRLRTAKGWSQAKLARESGLSSQGAIGNIESDARGYGESIVDIATALETNPDYLRLQSDDDSPSGGRLQASASIAKVSGTADDTVEAMRPMGAVPLISWVQAGSWSDLADPFQPGDADEWLPCPVKAGDGAYCLRVRGPSMHNPGGRYSYAPGSIIFVDPSREAKPGDRVIVRLEDQQEATFKQLLEEDGRKLLKALNPDWKPQYIEINGNATITGVVIGQWVPE